MAPAWVLLSIALLAPAALATPVSDRPYVIGANDSFEVFVWKQTDLSMSLNVTADGFVHYPLIGDLRVAGMTPAQVAKVIADGLRDYIVEPKVTVLPKLFDKPAVAVIGEVKSGGMMDYREGAHLSDYIAVAGGPTQEAKLSQVTVTRNVEGGAVNIEIDAEALFAAGDPAVDFVLREGDVVYVPTKFTLVDTRIVVLTATGIIGILATLLRGF